MDILSHKNYRELLDYLPTIKQTLKEWQLVDVRLLDEDEGFTVARAAALLQNLFKERDGKIYLCNDNDIFMLIRWGQANHPQQIARRIEATLPPGSCLVEVQQPTSDGLQKLVVKIKMGQAPEGSDASRRVRRRENVVLVADDDMYMRTLVKKGIAAQATLYEVDNGREVIAAYKKYQPDVLFLDIHLPGKTGTEILTDLMNADPDAYVIMFSSDSSKDNVELAMQQGARGFMTKPFSREKLMEYLKKCPTFLSVQAS
jgi:two-component system chemotaxis response regulator CheY